MGNLRKSALTMAVLVMTAFVFSKNYYVKQILIADANGDGKMDTTYQETYISDELIIISDEFSRSYIDNDSFTFYNTSDSSYFKKTYKELEEVMNSTDSQLSNFELTKTAETKKIGPWQTAKYLGKAKVMDMEMTLDMYIAKDTGFPVDLMIRQQDKMQKKSKNIKIMTDKIKATGGIVVKEVARIGGEVVSEKEIKTMKVIDKIESEVAQRPKGFKEMKK